jgi:hypothetical protein
MACVTHTFETDLRDERITDAALQRAPKAAHRAPCPAAAALGVASTRCFAHGVSVEKEKKKLDAMDLSCVTMTIAGRDVWQR